MSNQITGYSIVEIGEVGASDGGQTVHFELVDPNQQKIRIIVPYEKMSLVLFGLQTAMQSATEEQAKRPGFDPTQGSLKMGLKSYGTATGTALGKPPLVALRLHTEVGVVLDLMLPVAQAQQLGNELYEAASKASAMPPPKLS